MTGEWWCEAYGPPEAGAPVESWPRCFIATEVDERHCANAMTCASVMTSERRRVFDRVQQLADEGDELGAMLAAELTSPDELLGGSDSSGERAPQRPGEGI